MVSIIDKIRGRNRVESPEEAMRLAEIQEEARRRLEMAEKEAMVESEFLRQAKQRGLKVGRQQPSGNGNGGKQATGQGGSPIVPPVNVNVQTEKRTDRETFLIILLAYVIWIFDFTPYYGGPYEGYKFTKLLLLNTNFFAVATSGLVTFLLAVAAFRRIATKDRSFILYFILIALINSKPAQQIYELARIRYTIFFGDFSIPIVNIIVILSAFGVLVYFIRRHGMAFFDSELVAYLIMTFTFSFFWINWSWTANLKAVVHVGFIIIFCLFYLQPKEGTDKTGIYYLTSVFLVLDFFLYSIDLTAYGYPALRYFPILVILTTLYCDMFTESKFARINMFVLAGIILIVLIFVSPRPVEAGESLEKKTTTKTFSDFADKTFVQPAKNFYNYWSGKAESQLEFATGGAYVSKVEKSQFEPLGVYLDRIRAAQPRFYTDERVTLWGTILSRTLSDPAFVDFNCFRYGKDRQRIGIRYIKDGTFGEVNKAEGNIIPDKKFVVLTFEEKDVECNFNEKKFEAGTNTVTLSASYNFVTSAYKNFYLIDKDRYRALVKENVKPEQILKEFGGITDTSPKSTFTNGPVDIAADIGILPQNLLSVSDEVEPVKPTLKIRVQNRNRINDKQGKTIGQWDGRIKKINELVVVLPEGITIQDPSTDCTPKFEKRQNPGEQCQHSCNNFVFSPCEKTCVIKEDGTKNSKCVAECAEANKKCEDECIYIFQDELGNIKNYEAYYLDINQIRTRKEFEDIDKEPREFVCRITATSKALDNVRVTTKSVRIRARYDYLLEKTYSFPVQAPPTPVITYTPSKIDIDLYLKEKNSPMEGLGQCMKDAEARTKVPSVLMLGVAGHESRFGASNLARDFKNIYSITCGDYDKSGKCPFANKQDCCGNYVTYIGTTMSFRKYQDFCESINDFADLISTKEIYSEAMKYTNDPARMVQEMMKVGYVKENPQQWADSITKTMAEASNRITAIAKAQEQSKKGG